MEKFNKRTQILLSEEEYNKLKELSTKKNKSMSLLIREAVDNTYIKIREDKKNIIDKIVKLELPVDDWEKMKEEIEQGKYLKQ
ncbi:MAG: hypothetical protein M1371_11950 [Actinobacteria bacterium]|nr:hypothetical protein [Actinomycetota bacterium]